MKFTFAIKKLGAIDAGRALGHNCRTHPTESQLPQRAWFTKAGHHTITPPDAGKLEHAKRLAKRKDAVTAISVVIQIGNQTDWRYAPTDECPEGTPKPKSKWPANLETLAAVGQQWLEAEFGADNIVSVEIHTDESTPHLQAVVTPIKDGKLQAKAWLDGFMRMGQLRERAYKAVSKHIPCEYTKGGPGGAPHDPSAAGGKKRQPKPQPEPERGLVERLTGRARIADLEAANEKLRRQNEKLRQDNKTLHQAAFAKQKARFRAAADAEATKRAEAAEAARDAALREAAEAAKERDSAIQLGAALAAELDLFTPTERTKAKERRAQQKLEQERLAEQGRQAELQRKERQNRVDQLPHLAKTASGALATFANKARAAIAAHEGNWQAVDWRAIEQESLREAIGKNGQEPRRAIADVVAASPAAVAPQEAGSRIIELQSIVGRLRPSRGHGNDYDHGNTLG